MGNPITLKERLGSDLSGASLEWCEHQERAIDRIAALGRCSELGAALWRIRHANIARDMTCARTALGAAIKDRVGGLYLTDCRKVADQVLTEWLWDICTDCRGAKETANAHGVVDKCGTCHGLGSRRWNDEERMLAVGLPDRYRPIVDGAIKAGWYALTSAYADTARVLREQLER